MQASEMGRMTRPALDLKSWKYQSRNSIGAAEGGFELYRHALGKDIVVYASEQVNSAMTLEHSKFPNPIYKHYDKLIWENESQFYGEVDAIIKSVFNDDLAANYSLWDETKYKYLDNLNTNPKKKTFIYSHAHAVLKRDNSDGSVLIFNPWGLSDFSTPNTDHISPFESSSEDMTFIKKFAFVTVDMDEPF